MIDEIIEISDQMTGLRIDKFLAARYKDFSRSYIQKLINDEYITVDKSSVKNSYRIKKGDFVEVVEPEAEELELKPYPIDLDIIYEDSHIIVINKPAGLLVHPSPHEKEKTLVNAILHYTDNLSGIGGVKRPGIVHRLDRDTSGTIVVAKDDKSHKNLVEQFKNRETKKIYQAIACGNFQYNEGKIEAPIGRDSSNRTKMAVVKRNSKKAITFFKVLKRTKEYTFLEIKLKTGRTHQIRVHLSYLGYPILGDLKYGQDSKNIELNTYIKRQMLHAHNLGFYHPIEQKWMEFNAELPDDFEAVSNKIFD